MDQQENHGIDEAENFVIFLDDLMHVFGLEIQRLVREKSLNLNNSRDLTLFFDRELICLEFL